MKKIIMCAALALTAVAGVMSITGCKTTDLPEPQKVYTLSEGAGKATAIVVKLAKVDTNAVYAACAVLDQLETAIPGSNETFEAVWVPKAEVILNDLVEKGKIKEDVKPLVSLTVSYVCKGLDYEFKLHPLWKQYENLVAAAVNGFVVGFEGAYGYTAIDLFGTQKSPCDEADVEAICKLCGVKYMCPTARAAIVK